MFRYKVSRLGNIRKFEILRETEHTIWHNVSYTKGMDRTPCFREIQERKKTEGESWHDNYEDARQFIINDKQKRVWDLEKSLEEAKEQLVKAQNLKEDAI